MAYFARLLGTMGNLWRLGGMNGVVLKHNASNLQVRNAADTGYASLQCWRAQFAQNAAAGRIPVSDANGWLTLTDPGASGGAAQWYAGDIKASAQSADHGKWLKCDGRAVSRTTYATLFAACAGAFGAGDGSTTFNIPNMTNRFPYGAGGATAVGSTGGAALYTIGQSNLPVDTFISAGTSRVQVTTSGTTAPIQRKSTAADTMTILPPYMGLNFFIYTG